MHLEATNRLRRMIVRGALPSGADIAETDLCQDLGMSRTPLREAMKVLASEGLIELRRNRSARISAIDPHQVRELFEAVACVERCAAELAAQRITPAELRALARMQGRLERTHDTGALSEYFETNQKIHSAIVEASKNQVLVATHQWLMARVERARFLALRLQGRWTESVDEHRAVLDSLTARDGPRAGRELADHVLRTGDAVCRLVAEAIEGDAQ